MTFDEAFVALMKHEGHYSDDPLDPGGKTCWGITEAVARASGYTGYMNALTPEQAKDIYRKNYWKPVRADELPSEVRFDIFDGAVNSGVTQSIKWLQRAVGTAADGVIGPQTLNAVKNLPGTVIAARFNGQRLKFMTDLATWDHFGKGWARRIAVNLMEA